MPIADSSAPMVVGIRQTSSDTITMPVTPSPVSARSRARPVVGFRIDRQWLPVATAKMKMIVSAASRMFSAISFGVFCRLAPSTRAIIRSMKLARFLGDPDDDAVRQHRGAARHRRAVATGLPDHRGGLAGDGRFVHRGVMLPRRHRHRGSPVRADDDDVPLVQQRRGQFLLLGAGSTRLPSRRGGEPWCRPWSFAAIRPLCLATAFRDGRRGWRTPRSASQNDDQPGEPARREDRQMVSPDRADLDDEHDRIAPERARIQLAQGVRQGTSTAVSGQAGRHLFLRGRSARSAASIMLAAMVSSFGRGPSASTGRM